MSGFEGRYPPSDPVWMPRRALRLAPRLAHVLAAEIAGARQGKGGGGGGKPSSRAPVNLSAFDDAEALFVILAEWSRLTGWLPSGVRYNDAGGAIGYRGEVGGEGYLHGVEGMVDYLLSRGRDDLLGRTDAELARVMERSRDIFRIGSNHPYEDRERWVPTPCTCGERIVAFPPDWEGDEQVIVCSGCGQTFTVESLENVTEVAVKVARHHLREQGKSAARVRRNIARRNA